MKSEIIRAKALEANQRIRLAQDQVDVAGDACRTGALGTGPLDLAAQKLREALSAVDELLSELELEPGADVAPALRDCPSCGKSIRAQATLCGHCWTKL
jgi:hypothetical protein